MNDSIILEARALASWQRVRRGDSKVWHLSDDLFTDAVKAHLAGVSYAKVRAMLEERGIAQPDLPSKTGWSNFWQRFKPFLRPLWARSRKAAFPINWNCMPVSGMYSSDRLDVLACRGPSVRGRKCAHQTLLTGTLAASDGGLRAI